MHSTFHMYQYSFGMVNVMMLLDRRLPELSWSVEYPFVPTTAAIHPRININTPHSRQFLHVRHHHRTHYYMVYEYYSPVGGPSLAFYCIEGSEQRSEIWTKWPVIPAASMAKAVEALAMYAI